MTDFQFGDRLGSGGYGEVFSATIVETGETVAHKRLLPQWAKDDSARRRFDREVRLHRGLNHPNIMPVYESDLGAATPWYTMPLARTDLVKPARAHVGDEGFTTEVFLAMLEAVRAAHEAGVMHRDIKPQNALQLPDGRWVVSDFGAGREINRTTTTITRSHEGIGTFDYMSPEQYRDPQSCDERTDLFALGKLLLFLIVGDVYDAFRPAALPAHRFTPVLDRALQSDPAHRYQSAAEMIEGFVACLEPAEGWTRPESVIARIEQATGDGTIVDEDLDALTGVLAAYPDRPDFSQRTIPYLPMTLLAALRARAADTFRTLTSRLDSDVDTGSLPFAYCDTVAHFYRDLHASFPDDLELFGMILRRLLSMGHLHNRWHVRDVVASLLFATAGSDNLSMMARDAILGAPRASVWTFEAFSFGYAHPAVDDAIRTVRAAA